MSNNEYYQRTVDGQLTHMVGTELKLTVCDGGKAFHRNGIEKNLKTGATTHKRWVVGEINGVKLYINGNELILTTQDLNP